MYTLRDLGVTIGPGNLIIMGSNKLMTGSKGAFMYYLTPRPLIVVASHFLWTLRVITAREPGFGC